MNSLEENIKKARSICRGELQDENDIFYKIYDFTNESIRGYIDYFDLKNKSLLTVGSSGDQALNAIHKGANDITILDINPFTEYYVDLKITAIQTLSYSEFLLFFFSLGFNICNDSETTDIFSSVLFDKLIPKLKDINYDSYLFWNYLFKKFDKDRIRTHLFENSKNNKRNIAFNNYILTEEQYNITKEKIKNIRCKYINIDIFKYKDDKKYDNIFLSNLCTRFSLCKFKTILPDMKKQLNKGGSMLVGYLWNTHYDEENYYYGLPEAYNMSETKFQLGSYITEHPNVNGEGNYIYNERIKKDLVLIYRKNK